MNYNETSISFIFFQAEHTFPAFSYVLVLNQLVRAFTQTSKNLLSSFVDVVIDTVEITVEITKSLLHHDFKEGSEIIHRLAYDT